MDIFSSRLYRQALKVLGPHGPDAVLALLFFGGVLAAAPYLGFWPCACFALVLFALYGGRKVLHERHLERMAGSDIEKKQLAIADYCARQQVKLRKKTVTQLPQRAPARKGR